MASTTPKRIVLSDDPFVRREALAAAEAITPGQLIEFTTSLTVRKHATAAGNAVAMFAIENQYDDDNSVAAIDSPYGTADTVQYIIGRPGDIVYAWVTKQTTGSNVSLGNFLESAGSLGALKAYQSGTATNHLHRIVAQALEAVNNSAGTAAARIKVMVV